MTESFFIFVVVDHSTFFFVAFSTFARGRTSDPSLLQPPEAEFNKKSLSSSTINIFNSFL